MVLIFGMHERRKKRNIFGLLKLLKKTTPHQRAVIFYI